MNEGQHPDKDRSLVVRCEAVSKTFYSSTNVVALLRGHLRGPKIHALRNFSLQLKAGEICGVMGENGAGKSTFLRLVAGLLVPDSGRLEVLGLDVNKVGAAFRRRVCYFNCDERSFSWRLTGQQNLEFFASLYGYKRSPGKARSRMVLEQMELGPAAERAVREYSTGMRQRLALARGLLGDPELFLLDEPTRGVDPLAARRLRELIHRRISENGYAALVATHNFADVDELCDRVVLIERGQVRESGAAAEAQRMVGIAAEASSTTIGKEREKGSAALGGERE